MKVKDVIKKIPILYNPIVAVINRRNHRKRAKAYKEHGIEALMLFDKCMESNGFKYTLAFGSILGAIREHGFIKHDLDIDTFMWIDDFNPEIFKKLKDYGFTWMNNISIENDLYGREDTVQYKGVNIDIFYLYPPIDLYPYCCDFVSVEGEEKHKRLPRRIEIPISRNRIKVPFENMVVYVPDNAEQICEFRYGPSYMIPDSNWHWRSAYNAIREWPEMIQKTRIESYPKIDSNQ